MSGENFVRLKGKITKPSFIEYPSGAKIFKCDLAIPTQYDNKFQYIKVYAWSPLADSLNELSSGSFIKVYGRIERTTYDGKCRFCGNKSTSYWFEVGIDNFVILKES